MPNHAQQRQRGKALRRRQNQNGVNVGALAQGLVDGAGDGSAVAKFKSAGQSRRGVENNLI